MAPLFVCKRNICSGNIVNSNDYSGKCILQCTASVEYLQPATPAHPLQSSPSAGEFLQSTLPGPRVQRVYSRPVQIVLPRTIPAPRPTPVYSTPPPKLPVATYSKTIDFNNLNPKALYPKPTYYNTPMQPGSATFDFYKAGNSAMDYFAAGRAAGVTFGCIGGAAFMLEVAPVGCVLGAGATAAILAPAFAVWGFIAGGMDMSGSDAFDGFPDITTGLE